MKKKIHYFNFVFLIKLKTGYEIIFKVKSESCKPNFKYLYEIFDRQRLMLIIIEINKLASALDKAHICMIFNFFF